MGDRSNQKARTRAALVAAAIELIREGSQPSMPEAAERALVSPATGYRYFTSAEELWSEASMEAAAMQPKLAEADRLMDEAGDDPQARLLVAVQQIGWTMLDDQLPYRRLARAALDRWFAQVDVSPEERMPVREGRRNRHARKVLEPLEGSVEQDALDRIVAALGIVIGTDSMLALTDGVGLSAEQAKEIMADAARWMLAGALAEVVPHLSEVGNQPETRITAVGDR